MINADRPLPGTDVPTLGVEEEFLVVDPGSGLPVPVAGEVVDLANRLGADLQPELTRVQVKSTTPVCRTLREVRGHLLTARSMASAAALQTGARLLAVGVPLTGPMGQSFSDSDRYRRMGEGYGPLAAEHGVCGCHVHVAVPNREIAVQVCNHLGSRSGGSRHRHSTGIVADGAGGVRANPGSRLPVAGYPLLYGTRSDGGETMTDPRRDPGIA